MNQLIAKARESPTGWLLFCMVCGGIGAALGAVLSWSAKWPLPLALGIGAAFGILIATRALKQQPQSVAIAGPRADLSSWCTETLVLRHMNQADVHTNAVANTIDEEVAQAMGWSEDEIFGISHMAKDPALMAERGFIMIAYPLDVTQLLGVLSLTRLPGKPNEAGLGLWLSAGARGHGTGADSIRLAAQLCWQNGIKLITLGTTAANTHMQRCYLEAGADLFDSCENQLLDGRTVDSCWYRISNPHPAD
ncbi:MAG: GNAT family protein [Microthrixaceae bacterium]